MIQYNISIFVENNIEAQAIKALTKHIVPELNAWDFVEQAHVFEISSHQEPDSKGFSVQCLIPQSEEARKEAIESLISNFFLAEFPNQFVYFPSQLKRL
ncbi:MAG: hypothetical protein RLZ91_1805 [Bacteroidota bacterium]|jgi:Domain of unknown function (DUF4286)